MAVPALGIVFAASVAQGAAGAGEFYQDFRGQPLRPEVTLYGRDADRVIRPEAEGLRITLPAGRAQSGVVGISPAINVSGDFEITAGYEVLAADGFSDGAGPNLRILVGTPLREAASVGHYAYGNKKDAYCVVRTTATSGGRPNDIAQTIPCSAKAGKLRLTRSGADLSFSVAEGNGDQFRELHRTEFVKDECLVRLAAKTAPGKALDLRFIDLRIRAESLPQVDVKDLAVARPIAAPGSAAAAAPARRQAIRLLPIAVASGFVAVAVAGWALRRRRRMRT